MAIITYPLNNIEYTAEDAELYLATRTSGVFANDDFPITVPGDGNIVTIGEGIGWIRNSKFSGKVVANKTEMSLDLGLPHATYPRIDAIVLRFSANSNATEIIVKNGTAQTNPIPPNVVRTESVYELHLYHVYRPAGAASVTASNVTDLRMNESYCGIMRDGVTGIPTDQLQSQVDALLEQLHATIDNAGSLMGAKSVNGIKPDGTTGNVTLTAGDVGALAVSGGDMEGAINMTGQPISGLNDPTEDTHAARKGYVDASVRKAAPRNILDNSDFTNLVAQAGIGGNHGTIAYAADRWILDSGTVSYAAGVGLTLNGTIRQKLEFPPTGNATAFVGMASGEASIRYEDGAVTITSSGGVLKWAAMYGGVYSAATMPDYQPKGIAQERIACQRFFARADAWRPIYGYASWDGEISLFLPTLTEMRTHPTATTLKGTMYINGSSIEIDETPANVYKQTQGLQILLRTKTPENQKHNCALSLAETSAYFSADL